MRILEFGISDSDMDEVLFLSWLEERMELWPGEERHDEHTEEMRQILTGKPVDGGTESGLLICLPDDKPSGFLEYSIKDGMPGSDATSVHIEPLNEKSLAFHYAVGFIKTASDDESVFVEKIID